MAAAGGDFEAVFASGTAAAIHAYAAGVPRVINNLCETALAIAARRGAAALTPEIAVSTAVELCGLRPPSPGAETDDAPSSDAATGCGETDADDAVSDEGDGDRAGAEEAGAGQAGTEQAGAEQALADEAEAAGAAMAVAEAAAAETIVDETPGVEPLVGKDSSPEEVGGEDAAAADGGGACADPAVRAELEAPLPDDAQASTELALLEGDVVDVPSEEIPTLTESVELDFESGEYRLVTDQGRDESAAPRRAASDYEDEDDALESMSAELAEAIFGSDEPPPAAQPAQASRGAAGRAAEIVELSGRSGSGTAPRQTSPSTLKPARRMP